MRLTNRLVFFIFIIALTTAPIPASSKYSVLKSENSKAQTKLEIKELKPDFKEAILVVNKKPLQKLILAIPNHYIESHEHDEMNRGKFFHKSYAPENYPGWIKMNFDISIIKNAQTNKYKNLKDALKSINDLKIQWLQTGIGFNLKSQRYGEERKQDGMSMISVENTYESKKDPDIAMTTFYKIIRTKNLNAQNNDVIEINLNYYYYKKFDSLNKYNQEYEELKTTLNNIEVIGWN